MPKSELPCCNENCFNEQQTSLHTMQCHASSSCTHKHAQLNIGSHLQNHTSMPVSVKLNEKQLCGANKYLIRTKARDGKRFKIIINNNKKTNILPDQQVSGKAKCSVKPVAQRELERPVNQQNNKTNQTVPRARPSVVRACRRPSITYTALVDSHNASLYRKLSGKISSKLRFDPKIQCDDDNNNNNKRMAVIVDPFNLSESPIQFQQQEPLGWNGDSRHSKKSNKRKSTDVPSGLSQRRVCSSMQFDVAEAKTGLRDKIEHPNRKVAKQLREMGADKILGACRPAKCCRRAVLNEESDPAMPYSASLKSLPLSFEDLTMIEKSLRYSQLRTEAKVRSCKQNLSYYVGLGRDDPLTCANNAYRNQEKKLYRMEKVDKPPSKKLSSRWTSFYNLLSKLDTKDNLFDTIYDADGRPLTRNNVDERGSYNTTDALENVCYSTSSMSISVNIRMKKEETKQRKHSSRMSKKSAECVTESKRVASTGSAKVTQEDFHRCDQVVARRETKQLKYCLNLVNKKKPRPLWSMQQFYEMYLKSRMPMGVRLCGGKDAPKEPHDDFIRFCCHQLQKRQHPTHAQDKFDMASNKEIPVLTCTASACPCCQLRLKSSETSRPKSLEACRCSSDGDGDGDGDEAKSNESSKVNLCWPGPQITLTLTAVKGTLVQDNVCLISLKQSSPQQTSECSSKKSTAVSSFTCQTKSISKTAVQCECCPEATRRELSECGAQVSCQTRDQACEPSGKKPTPVASCTCQTEAVETRSSRDSMQQGKCVCCPEASRRERSEYGAQVSCQTRDQACEPPSRRPTLVSSCTCQTEAAETRSSRDVTRQSKCECWLVNCERSETRRERSECGAQASCQTRDEALETEGAPPQKRHCRCCRTQTVREKRQSTTQTHRRKKSPIEHRRKSRSRSRTRESSSSKNVASHPKKCRCKSRTRESSPANNATCEERLAKMQFWCRPSSTDRSREKSKDRERNRSRDRTRYGCTCQAEEQIKPTKSHQSYHRHESSKAKRPAGGDNQRSDVGRDEKKPELTSARDIRHPDVGRDKKEPELTSARDIRHPDVGRDKKEPKIELSTPYSKRSVEYYWDEGEEEPPKPPSVDSSAQTPLLRKRPLKKCTLDREVQTEFKMPKRPSGQYCDKYPKYCTPLSTATAKPREPVSTEAITSSRDKISDKPRPSRHCVPLGSVSRDTPSSRPSALEPKQVRDKPLSDKQLSDKQPVYKRDDEHLSTESILSQRLSMKPSAKSVFIYCGNDSCRDKSCRVVAPLVHHVRLPPVKLSPDLARKRSVQFDEKPHSTPGKETCDGCSSFDQIGDEEVDWIGRRPRPLTKEQHPKKLAPEYLPSYDEEADSDAALIADGRQPDRSHSDQRQLDERDSDRSRSDQLHPDARDSDRSRSDQLHPDARDSDRSRSDQLHPDARDSDRSRSDQRHPDARYSGERRPDKSHSDQRQLDERDSDRSRSGQLHRDKSYTNQSHPDIINRSDQSSLDKSHSDQRQLDERDSDKSRSDQLHRDKSHSNQSNLDKSRSDQSYLDKSHSDQRQLDERDSDKSRSEQSHLDKSRSDQRDSDKSRSDQLHPDKSRSDQRHPDKSRSNQLHPDKSRSNQRPADKSRSNQRHPDAAHSDQLQHPDSRHSDERHPDKSRSTQRHPDAAHSDQLQHPDSRHSDERHPDKSRSTQRHPDTAHSDQRQQPDSRHSDEHQPDKSDSDQRRHDERRRATADGELLQVYTDNKAHEQAHANSLMSVTHFLDESSTAPKHETKKEPKSFEELLETAQSSPIVALNPSAASGKEHKKLSKVKSNMKETLEQKFDEQRRIKDVEDRRTASSHLPPATPAPVLPELEEIPENEKDTEKEKDMEEGTEEEGEEEEETEKEKEEEKMKNEKEKEKQKQKQKMEEENENLGKVMYMQKNSVVEQSRFYLPIGKSISSNDDMSNKKSKLKTVGYSDDEEPVEQKPRTIENTTDSLEFTRMIFEEKSMCDRKDPRAPCKTPCKKKRHVCKHDKCCHHRGN